MGDGKVIIVTGGTYGLGRGITLHLAKCGYRVVAFALMHPSRSVSPRTARLVPVRSWRN